MSDAVSRLTYYQEWRRGSEGSCPCPKQLGQDIDEAIAALEQLAAKGSALDVAAEALEAIGKASAWHEVCRAWDEKGKPALSEINKCTTCGRLDEITCSTIGCAD